MVDSFEELLWIFDHVRNPPKPVLLGSRVREALGYFEASQQNAGFGETFFRFWSTAKIPSMEEFT